MKNKKKYILVTGCAGFIGYHLSIKLLKNNFTVIGIDNINNYYSQKLKTDRIKDIKKFCKKKNKKFMFYKYDLSNKKKLNNLFNKFKFEKVIHLAAQAGVRYSLIYPERYLNNNIVCFFNILESCRKYKVCLLYTSPSPRD